MKTSANKKIVYRLITDVDTFAGEAILIMVA